MQIKRVLNYKVHNYGKIISCKYKILCLLLFTYPQISNKLTDEFTQKRKGKKEEEEAKQAN